MATHNSYGVLTPPEEKEEDKSIDEERDAEEGWYRTKRTGKKIKISSPQGIRDAVKVNGRTKIACQKSVMEFQSQGVKEPQEQKMKENLFVRLSTTVEVSARSEILLSGKIEGLCQEASQVLVQPFSLGQPGVMVASILATVQKQTVPVRMIKTRKDTVRLPKGLVVARVVSLEEEAFVIGNLQLRSKSDLEVIDQPGSTLRRISKKEFSQHLDLDHVPESQRHNLLSLFFMNSGIPLDFPAILLDLRIRKSMR